MERVVLNSMDCIRVLFTGDQSLYYLPYTNKNRRVSRIYCKTGHSGNVDITGNTIATEPYLESVFVTIGNKAGGLICKDLPIMTISNNTQTINPIKIDAEIDYDNSYIKVTNYLNQLTGKVLMLYLVYEDVRTYTDTVNKIMRIDFPDTSMQPLRMTDYINGYQGKLKQIEIIPTIIGGNVYLTLNDQYGRSLNFADVSFFYYLGRVKYNTFWFAGWVPVWQNSFVCSNTAFSLYLYFE